MRNITRYTADMFAQYGMLDSTADTAAAKETAGP